MTTRIISFESLSVNLLVYVRKLLRLRWMIFVSGFNRSKPLHKVLTIGLGLLVLAVFYRNLPPGRFASSGIGFAPGHSERDQPGKFSKIYPLSHFFRHLLIDHDGQFQAAPSGTLPIQ